MATKWATFSGSSLLFHACLHPCDLVSLHLDFHLVWGCRRSGFSRAALEGSRNVLNVQVLASG